MLHRRAPPVGCGETAQITGAQDRLDPLAAHLTQPSTMKILDRGYALVTNESGHIVKDPADAPVNSDVATGLAKSGIVARVIEK